MLDSTDIFNGCPMRFNLRSPIGRALAWLDMHLVDHGFIRAMYNNWYDLTGGLYRCSQPSPNQIREYHKVHGIKTIINLRGENPFGSYYLEEEACRELGISLITYRFYSRQPPKPSEIHGFKDLLSTLEYPAIMHCKSGADRAGIASALYRILHLGQDVQSALSELNWRYGHFRKSDAGVLDFFFESYLLRNARSPIAFLDWVDTEYDWQEMHRRYEKSGWSSLVADTILRRE